MAASVGLALPKNSDHHGYLSEHKSFGQTEMQAGDYAEDLAAEMLATKKIRAEVINLHTIKPFDEKTVLAAAKRCGAVVTAEEHQLAGGLGSAVAEVLARKLPVPIEFVAVQDRFGQSGKSEELLVAYGLTAQNIVSAAKKVIQRKL